MGFEPAGLEEGSGDKVGQVPEAQARATEVAQGGPLIASLGTFEVPGRSK